ncbi:MAG TPA: HlyD family efflux transporter periplasmic adaptor subunit [Dongiaceae bacterium]|nr:HlyD family efflux transporter periplasmic adaptor subunit [Dongiaceae bacterium]
MNPEPRPPVPIPFALRVRHAQRTLLPLVVFGGLITIVAVLWQRNIAAPTMVAQAESVVTEVSSGKTGLVAGLNVSRFQHVHAGDTIGHVITNDPKLIEASLAVIHSELDMLRANLKPIVAQQRNAVDYAQLRIDWMRERVGLASARVNLQLAEAEFHRNEQLFADKVLSVTEMDISRANFQALQQQVLELDKLVVDGEQSFSNMQASVGRDISQISDEPMRVAVALQDAKLRLTETQLSPVDLQAPIDGVIMAVLRRSGETVTAGQPIVTIAATTPARIVGYLRTPLAEDPRPGMTVQVCTRGLHRETGKAQILEVGAQLEPLPAALQSGAKLAGVELGLPVDVSVPPNLKIRPGEVVDVILTSRVN